jgi:serine/threonine protein kinase
MKPENIFLEKDTAKIGDFGLARGLDVRGSKDKPKIIVCRSPEKKNGSLKNLNSIYSHFSSVAGTEAYMAPELSKHYLNGTLPEKFTDISIN